MRDRFITHERATWINHALYHMAEILDTLEAGRVPNEEELRQAVAILCKAAAGLGPVDSGGPV